MFSNFTTHMQGSCLQQHTEFLVFLLSLSFVYCVLCQHRQHFCTFIEFFCDLYSPAQKFVGPKNIESGHRPHFYPCFSIEKNYNLFIVICANTYNFVSYLAICLCVLQQKFWLCALNGCIILVNRRNSQLHSHPLGKEDQKANNLANVMDEGPLVPPVAIGPKPASYLVSYIFLYAEHHVCLFSKSFREKNKKS